MGFPIQSNILTNAQKACPPNCGDACCQDVKTGEEGESVTKPNPYSFFSRANNKFAHTYFQHGFLSPRLKPDALTEVEEEILRELCNYMRLTRKDLENLLLDSKTKVSLKQFVRGLTKDLVAKGMLAPNEFPRYFDKLVEAGLIPKALLEELERQRLQEQQAHEPCSPCSPRSRF
jgi:hypothetical protein